jgi:hypothetical protein
LTGEHTSRGSDSSFQSAAGASDGEFAIVRSPPATRSTPVSKGNAVTAYLLRHCWRIGIVSLILPLTPEDRTLGEMLRFFTFRPTDADQKPDVKRWLNREMVAGRLRQGWLSEVPLVTVHGQLVNRGGRIRRHEEYVDMIPIHRHGFMRRNKHAVAALCP